MSTARVAGGEQTERITRARLDPTQKGLATLTSIELHDQTVKPGYKLVMH